MSISPFIRDLLDLPGGDVLFDVTWDVPTTGMPTLVSGEPFLSTLGVPPSTQQQPRGIRRKEEREEKSTWRPAVDVMEEHDHIVIFVELPGMKKDDINLNFSVDVLEIRGKKSIPSGGKLP